VTKLINKWGDKMLGVMLPKNKASACSHCQRAYAGCGGGQCFFYYNRFCGASMCCFAFLEDSCTSNHLVSWRHGCC
jgi:hypothetical protein